MLPNLYKSVPIVRCKAASAVRTLSVFFDKLNDFGLLNSSTLIYCSDKVDLDAYAFGVGFSPHKFGIPEFGFMESSHLLEHGSKQFGAFSFAIDPRRALIAMAIDAVLLLLIGGKDSLVLQRRERAGGADVLLGGSEFDAAEGA
jgi:hypothetical protein